ncbi:hypothetical protein [Fructilactobacillus sanfranciscensis]|uniref:hypothetical protein n=1 Tax=Fructilactobacillus sanfranciscensis TaxID=1625 RepID=UPI0031F75EE8
MTKYDSKFKLKAINFYKNNPCLSGAIIHSHYQLESYRKWIDKQNVLQSMSRKGNCLDNSPGESQIGVMKKECLYRD